MTSRFNWPPLLWLSGVALALVLVIRSDLAHLRWVSELSMQGSPPPAADAGSPTGYALGQRYFLGTHERGETYRWIAATQDLVASGPFAVTWYAADTVPVGRPRLMPRLYAWWLTGVSWGLHLVTGEPLPLSTERAALWEPLISHVLALLAAAAFAWRRYGPGAATVAALFFAGFPALFGQFIPGVLTARTWALLLSAYALALCLPTRSDDRKNLIFSARTAIAASLALWLDPAFGFPAVLILAVVGAVTGVTRKTALPGLRWALIGSGLTFAAWLIDRSPWLLSAGELRYLHPLYALAWLGLGLIVDGILHPPAAGKLRLLRIGEYGAGALLVGTLVFIQFKHDYLGWLYSSAALRRLTSLDETLAFHGVFDWIRGASGAEVAFTLAPGLAAVLALGIAFRRRGSARGPVAPWLLPAVVLLLGVAVFAFFRVRWGVVAALMSLAVLGTLAANASRAFRLTTTAISAVFLLALAAWATVLPASFRRPTASSAPGPADLEALVHRHFAFWLASHTPGQQVSALAPPDLSDSLVFHGGCRVLLSSAWESYPGQVAASRVLSAPEATEAEAMIQSRELTHIILPSWDPVLPLLLQSPPEGRDTLFARLQRWVLPAYLRPIPYRLPPLPAFAAQKLAVFKVTPPQDEALALSRLAEYFVEMERREPAALAAKVLADSYPTDPNAAIARATVYAQLAQPAEFAHELDRLASDATADRSPFSWDRRVQRAIVLALGHRPELARREIEACLASATRDDLFELTPLQAFRLQTLAKAFHASFADPALAGLLAALGAEFSAAAPKS